MWNAKKSVTLSLILVYIAMAVLAVITVAMPWLVTWYVESKGREASLPTTIMVTCYPCVPFAAAALLSLRRLLVNIGKSDVIIKQNVTMLHRISWCCFFCAVITLAAGRFYLPFYIVGAAAAFFTLIIRVFKNLLEAELKSVS